MLNLRVTRPDGTVIEATTTKAHLRLKVGKAKKPVSAVLVVPVPVVETVYLAPPPAPSAEEIAYAILHELEGLEQIRRDIQQPEEETRNGQRSWASLRAAFSRTVPA